MSTSPYLISHDDKHINFYSPKTGDLVKTETLPKKFKAGVRAEDYCKNCQANENEICIGDLSGNIFVIDLRNNSVVEMSGGPYSSSMYCLKAIKEGENVNLLVSGDIDAVVGLWDVRKRKFLHQFSVNEEDTDTYALTFLDSANSFAAGTSEERIYFFDTEKLKPKKVLQDHGSSIDFSYHEELKLLASVSMGNSCTFYDIREKKEVRSISYSYYMVSCLFWKNPLYNHRLYLGNSNGDIFCLDTRKLGRMMMDPKLFEFKEIHRNFINRIIDNNSNLRDSLVSCSEDKFIKIFDAQNGKIKCQIREKCKVFGMINFDSRNFGGVQYMIKDLLERIEFLYSEDFNSVRINFRISRSISVLRLILV